MEVFQQLSADALNSIGVVGLSLFFTLLVITDKLIWHKRLTAAIQEKDEWRAIALRGMGVAEQTTAHAEALVQAVEVASEPTP